MLVNQRLIISGNRSEILDFGNVVLTDCEPLNPDGRNGNATDEQKKNNRIRTIQKNKSSFTRYYHANKEQHKHKDKFMTITFRNLPETIALCDNELKKFIKRLKRYTKTEIQYQGIRELQMEALRFGNHYHIIFYNLPFIPHEKLLELWCVGNPYQDANNRSGVNIKAIQDGLDDVKNYLTSYLLVELLENDFLQGHKIMLKSKGLKKPSKIDLPEKIYKPQIDEIEKALSFIDNKITYYLLKE